jgi:endonuclease/exonuclease/phosphatase family metal-dependent hydrolase
MCPFVHMSLRSCTSGFYSFACTRFKRWPMHAALDADEMHAAAMRLDYMLGNALTASMLVAPATAVATPESGMLSDHYPVQCVIELRHTVCADVW